LPLFAGFCRIEAIERGREGSQKVCRAGTSPVELEVHSVAANKGQDEDMTEVWWERSRMISSIVRSCVAISAAGSSWGSISDTTSGGTKSLLPEKSMRNELVISSEIEPDELHERSTIWCPEALKVTFYF
jgi:hypothetical protein